MSFKTFACACCCIIVFVTTMGCPLPEGGIQLFPTSNPSLTPYPTSTPFPTPTNTFLATYRTFEAQKITDGTWYNVDSTLLATGTHCAIYAENSQINARITEATAANIASTFDNNIYTLIQTKFYTASDVDSNGKIIILFLDIVDGYSGSDYVAGYFHPLHCLAMTHSNQADMLFMDTNPSIPGDSSSLFTIAHEFQHLVNFNRTYLEGGGNQQDVWINEGLSSAAEYLYLGSHVTSKIDYYNADPKDDIAYGVNFVIWAPDYAGSAYTSYATVYLFFQWLRLQSSNGEGIYYDILNTPYYDYRAVEAAASSSLYTGTWAEFFRDWLIANAFYQTTGKYGYKSDLGTTLTPPYTDYTFTGGSFPLLPGEAVYAIETTPPFSATSTSYRKYCGLNTTSESIVATSPFTGCDIILAYNSNGSTSGAMETVSLPVNSLEFALAPHLTPAENTGVALPESYPIDVQWPGGVDKNPLPVSYSPNSEEKKQKLNNLKGLQKK